MDCLDILLDEAFSSPTSKTVCYNIRNAARSILFNDEKIALLYVSHHNYHKLPGGGIERDETQLQALRREVLEETGCVPEVLSEVGYVIEFRRRIGMMQRSYCYLARATPMSSPTFTQEEISQGFELKWVDASQALDILRRDSPDNYEGRCIKKRDTLLLEHGLRAMDGLTIQKKNNKD